MIALSLFGIITTVSFIPVVGWFVGPAVQSVGLVLGMVISMCLSITMGGALMVALALNGMFYWSKLIPAFAELIPGINNGPVWTIVVVRCMMKNYKDEHGVSMFGRKKTAISADGQDQPKRFSPTAVAARYVRRKQAAILAPIKEKQDRPAPAALKNFDGIRPANDNRPQPYAQAA